MTLRELKRQLASEWQSGNNQEAWALVEDLRDVVTRTLRRDYKILSAAYADDCFDAAVEKLVERANTVKDPANYVFKCAFTEAVDLITSDRQLQYAIKDEHYRRNAHIPPNSFGDQQSTFDQELFLDGRTQHDVFEGLDDVFDESIDVTSTDHAETQAQVETDHDYTYRSVDTLFEALTDAEVSPGSKIVEEIIQSAIAQLPRRRRQMAEILIENGPSVEADLLADLIGTANLSTIRGLKKETLDDLRLHIPVVTLELGYAVSDLPILPDEVIFADGDGVPDDDNHFD